MFALAFSNAQTSTKNTTLITNCSTCSGTYTWNFSTPMDPDITFSSIDFSRDLQSSNYGFSIPTGATILGIEVLVQYQSTFSSPTMYISDTLVSLLKGGVVVGNSNHSMSPAFTATNVTPVNYGGSTDLWGTTWTPADINAAGFGFNFKLFANFPNLQLKLWQGILITVHYSTSTGIIQSQSNYSKINNVVILNDKIKFKNFEFNNNSKFEILDLTGKIILTANHIETNEISISNLTPGVYFYRLQQSGEIKTAKFVVK